MKKTEKEDTVRIKAVLFKVFVLPPSEAYEQMLCLGEAAVSVYMSALQKLARLFGTRERWRMRFWLGFPLRVKELL